MQKINYFFLLLMVSFAALVGCNKETPIENYDYARIIVIYKNFSQAPGITVHLDNSLLGSLQPGRTREDLILATNNQVNLKIKRETTGELLLDSSFVPARLNNFTLFITDLLNVAQFYTPPPQPVNVDSFRIQLLNNIKIQHTGKKINFKFFVPLMPTLTGFEQLTGYELNNVPYGKLSEPIDIPKLKYPAPQPQTVLRPVYIKAYDAETGQLLVDLKTGTANNTYGNVIQTGSYTTPAGKYNVINVSVVESGSEVSYVRPFPSYPM